MRSKETIDTIFIKGLYNSDNYGTFNPIEIRLEQEMLYESSKSITIGILYTDL